MKKIWTSCHTSANKNIAMRLNAMDTKVEDQQIISKILATLPQEYKHFATAWKSTPRGERTVKNLTARLIAEEMRNKDRQLDEKAVAFKAINKKCYKCNKQGYVAKDCRSKNRSNEKEIRCFKCNKKGHLARSCDEKSKTERCSICKKTIMKKRITTSEKKRNQRRKNRKSSIYGSRITRR